MLRNFTPILLALGIFMIGCDDDPIDPCNELGENVIANGTFETTLSQGGNIVTGEEASPWASAYGTPQIGAGNGYDTKPGYLQMWGNADLGECAYQKLEKPLRKGKTYILTASAKFMDDNPDNYTRHARVRFVAFTTRPSSYNLHWRENRPNVAVVGSLTTSDTNWKEYTVGEWTADADYTGFAINAENNTRDNNTPNTVSWVKVDNVSLREKK